MRIDCSQVVKAPREQVFQTFSDLETFPKFFDPFKRVTATERAGNRVTWEIEAMFRGRIAKRTEKWVMTPPEQILVDGKIEGITNRSVWKFEPIAEGTRVTGTMEFQLKWWMKALRPIVKRQIQALVRNYMETFAKHVEAK